MAGLFGAVVLAALTGCPPTYPKCDNDAQCSEKGEVCVQGQCKECGTDENCKAGFVCDTNKCVPKPECGPGAGPCGTGKNQCLTHGKQVPEQSKDGSTR